MSKKENRIIKDSKEIGLNIREIKPIKKYPFLGFSTSLIDYFLVLGYDSPTKKDIISNIFRIENKNQSSENKDSRHNSSSNKNNKDTLEYQEQSKPVVLSSIGSDNINANLNEELIIKHMFPNNYVSINYDYFKNEQIKTTSGNIVLYLKANKIFEFDDAHNDKNEKLKNDTMYSIFGYLFTENHVEEEKIQNAKNKLKIYFPKCFIFISQYPYFKYYESLSRNIVQRIKNNNHIEIPFEIQLYNLVNFTPSPINCNLQLNLLVNDFINNLKKTYSSNDDAITKLKKNNDNSAIKILENNFFINQLSAFPYIDINIPFLFIFCNIDIFLIIYIFSFLEIKCIFFCNNLELLNLIMYLLYIFSYPFLEISESGQVYSVSKDEILDSSKILKNNIIGVNANYEPNMGLSSEYNNYIIINCEYQNLTTYYQGENMNKYESSSDVSKLYHYLKKFLNDIPQDDKDLKGFLKTKVYPLYNYVNQSCINYSNQIENYTDEKMKISESFFLHNNKYDINDEINKNIQKEFYSFNISIMEYFHDMLKLEESFDDKNELKDPNISAYFKLSFVDNKELKEKSNKSGPNSLSEEDKIFLNYFRQTKKLNDYIENFLINNECQEIKRMSLIMSEEFMNIKKGKLKDFNRDYYYIINKFYHTSTKVRKINYNKFYIHYSDNLAKTLFDYANETKAMKLINDNKNKIDNKTGSYKYQYIETENILDNNVLKRYFYILENMEQTTINNLFPHLKFKLNENNIDEIQQNLFADYFELYLLENKVYSLENIISFIVLIIYIITLKKNKAIYHFFEEIMKSKIITHKCLIRKYIYIILYILNEKVQEKIKLKKNFIKELLIYKEIMTNIYAENQKESNNSYNPNELLSDIIKNFNVYQNYYANVLKNNPGLSTENKKIINSYNNNISMLLEDGIDYEIFVQNNSCLDKGMIKDGVLINVAQALEYKGTIQTTCKTCKFKIKPNLNFIFAPGDKSRSIAFYSLMYSYKNAIKLLNKILSNNEKGNIDDDYFNLCGNMIFYINFREGNNNLLSRYIATTLI